MGRAGRGIRNVNFQMILVAKGMPGKAPHGSYELILTLRIMNFVLISACWISPKLLMGLKRDNRLWPASGVDRISKRTRLGRLYQCAPLRHSTGAIASVRKEIGVTYPRVTRTWPRGVCFQSDAIAIDRRNRRCRPPGIRAAARRDASGGASGYKGCVSRGPNGNHASRDHRAPGTR